MYFNFGSRLSLFGKKGGKKTDSGPYAPELGGALPSAFGRYLRYGRRRSAFGRRYFGASRFPQFGKKGKKKSDADAEEEEMEFGSRSRFGLSLPNLDLKNPFGKKTEFGRRHRRGARKGGRKARKPSKALMRMCRKHGIKCTKKVGKKRVYKSISVLKKQLRRKKSLRKRKHRKVRKARKARKVRRSHRKVRRTRRRRVTLFGLKF